jgi:hypothetical protein
MLGIVRAAGQSDAPLGSMGNQYSDAVLLEMFFGEECANKLDLANRLISRARAYGIVGWKVEDPNQRLE